MSGSWARGTKRAWSHRGGGGRRRPHPPPADAPRRCRGHHPPSDPDPGPSALFAVNKPVGWSSAKVTNIIKATVRAATGVRKPKVGHGGTLDPMATGVLVVGIGHGCKLLGSLLTSGKEYKATMRLGQVYDTQDATGTLLHEHAYTDITLQGIQEVLPQFTGEIQQRPPVFSAVHVPIPGDELQRTTRAYKLAREGQLADIQGEIQSRRALIHRIELLNEEDTPLPQPYTPRDQDTSLMQCEPRMQAEESEKVGEVGMGQVESEVLSSRNEQDSRPWQERVGLYVHSASGVYIRTIIHDIGQVLGCGAHMTALVRTSAGPFQLQQSLREEEFRDWSVIQRQCDKFVVLQEQLRNAGITTAG